MINLELYRIFSVVANEENLTKASKILHISQPAVTKHIKNLENQLNIKLFERTKYGMKLTEKGQNLFLQIKDSINILNNVDEQFSKNRDINLGSHVAMLSRMFENAVSKFYKENSNSQINVTNEPFSEMISRLENQKLDMVLSKKGDKNLYDENKIKYISLGLLHDVFVIRTDSKYANKIFSKDDLKKELIYTPRNSSITTLKLMQFFNFKENETEHIRHSTYTTMLGILKNEDIIGIITKEYIKEELSENKLKLLKTDFNLEPIEYGIYYNLNNQYSELKSLIKILKEESKKF